MLLVNCKPVLPFAVSFWSLKPYVTYEMSTLQNPYRIGRRAGYQGPRPPAGGQAGVEKYATGHHYSEVASSGWSGHNKRLQTHNTKRHHHNISIGSINTTTLKDPMKLAQCVSQCKFLKNSITFVQETHIFGQHTTKFDLRYIWMDVYQLRVKK